MAIHIILGTAAPTSAPPKLGAHYVDTVNKVSYIAVGTGTSADWQQTGFGATDVAALIHAATSKTSPVDADEVPITDSATSYALKKLTLTNLKAFLKTYFDTLYSAGSGTVTSVDASGGVQVAAGSPITGSGTIRAANVINAQSGTSYALVAGDRWKHVTLNNASAIAVTIAQAGTIGFEDGWGCIVECTGAGDVTITPSVSVINGSATLVLTSGMSAFLYSDGANYRAITDERGGVAVNAQTGTSYTYVSGDRGKLVTHSNAASIAGTLPQATGAFGANWYAWVENRGAGTLTITPTTSTIDGASSLALTANQGCLIASDGTNYFTVRGIGGGGGGLTNFSEAANSSSPNATIPVASLTPNNAASSVDVAIVPKGSSGSLLASIPDNNATGGNKRGVQAVDLQTNRSSASQVASGDYAVVAGGQKNTASNTYAAVPGGSNNNASGNASFVAGGSDNTSSGTSSFTACASNTASAQGSVAVGLSNSASGTCSMAIGQNNNCAGRNSMVRGYTGDDYSIKFCDVWSNGFRSAFGDRQTIRVPLVIVTTNSTATAITSDASSAAATNQLNVGSGLSTKFKAQVVARRNDGATAGWDIFGVAKNVSGTLSIVGTPTVTQQAADAAISAYTVAVVADNTNKCVQIQVTGATGDTVYWKGMLEGEIVG